MKEKYTDTDMNKKKDLRQKREDREKKYEE